MLVVPSVSINVSFFEKTLKIKNREKLIENREKLIKNRVLEKKIEAHSLLNRVYYLK